MFRLFFSSLKENRKKILEVLLPFLFIGLIFLCSGNGYTLLFFNSKIRIVIYGVIGIILLILNILSVKPNFLIRRIKNKKIPFSSLNIFILFSLLMVFWILLSILINPNRGINLYNYLDIIFVIIASSLFINCFSFKKFVLNFNRLLTVISFFSIIIFILVYISRVDFSLNSFVSGVFRYDNYFFLSLFYNEKLYNIGGSPRMLSVFWEPGVYGTFLIIGLVFEIKFKKTNFLTIALYLVCIFFTKSSATYLLLLLVFALFIHEKIKKNRDIILIIYLISLMALAFLFLVFGKQLSDLLPSIFGKIYDGSISFLSRVYSPYYYFLTFISSFRTILFGMGGVSANEYYLSISLSTGLIDSGTSTSAYYLAAYGFLGSLFTILPIIGIFFLKKGILEKVIYCLLFILITNKENHASVLSTSIIAFYLIKCIPAIPMSKKKKSVLKDATNDKTVKDLLISSKSKMVFSTNIIGTMTVRILAVLVSVITLPIYTSYFSNSHSLDVWLVIYSVLSWILIFDFGFGNGMKNKLIQSISSKDFDKAKQQVSNTFFPTAFIGLSIFLVLLILCLAIDLNVVFGDADHLISSLELRTSLIIISLSICLQFFLRNITFVLQAKKHNIIANSFSLISSSSLLLLLVLFRSFDLRKFLFISIAYLVSINLPLLIANIVFFSKNKNIAPSAKLFSPKGTKDVMTLGIKYFTVQLCTLALWSANTMLITHFFDPASELRYVYFYTCFYKIFSTIASLISIISATVWVEAGEALATRNFLKIKKLKTISIAYSTLLTIGTILVSLLIQIVFDLWLGDNSFAASFNDTLIFAIYGLLTIIAETLIIFANAFSKLKSQLIVSIVFAILKIPVLFLLKYVIWTNVSWNIVVVFNLFYLLFVIIFVAIELNVFAKKAGIEYKPIAKSEFKEPADNYCEVINYDEISI